MNVFGEIVSPFLMDAKATSTDTEKDLFISAENTQCSDSLSKTSSQTQLDVEDIRKESQIDNKAFLKNTPFKENDVSIVWDFKVFPSNDGLYHYLDSENSELSNETQCMWPLLGSSTQFRQAQAEISTNIILDENQWKKPLKKYSVNDKIVDNFLEKEDYVFDYDADSESRKYFSMISTNAETQTSPITEGKLRSNEISTDKTSVEDKLIGSLRTENSEDAFNYFFPNAHLFLTDSFTNGSTPTNFRNLHKIQSNKSTLNGNNSSDGTPIKFMMPNNRISNNSSYMMAPEPINSTSYFKGATYQNQFGHEFAQPQFNYSPFKRNTGVHEFQPRRGVNNGSLRIRNENMSYSNAGYMKPRMINFENYSEKLNNIYF